MHFVVTKKRSENKKEEFISYIELNIYEII